MEKLIEKLSRVFEETFQNLGYEGKYGKVTISNRPDLCEFQCNGAMAAAKTYKKAPIVIANEVVDAVKNTEKAGWFEKIETVSPGFVNLVVAKDMLAQHISAMAADERLGLEKAEKPRTIIIDYGGANVAKPLHVGHLRPAIIGESIKRIARHMGHNVIGDVHLGDWGLPMGLVITELKHRQPELPYFDESFTGEYPTEPPFTIQDLEEIYPYASGRSKEDEAYKAEALAATKRLQQKEPGCYALWKHILEVSKADLKINYGKLNVTFDLWKGESDVDSLIPEMVGEMKEKGFAYMSEGALVVDVSEKGDAKEIPPCMILKSDGAALYQTTDLATLKERRAFYNPDEVIYVVDKRQELHFTQVFRCAKKTGLIEDRVSLKFIGNGTMNGKDGKPFKTRDGGVMRLERLLSDVKEEMLKKIRENSAISGEEAEKTAEIIGLAALKYGDLANQATKDYCFDMERFTSSEGNTGPYILYTIVRIKSILNKYKEQGGQITGEALLEAANESEKKLTLELSNYQTMIEAAFEESAPHKVCSFMYDLSNAFNHFYHETKILSEENEGQKASWIRLLDVTRRALETCIDLLAFEAPERM